MAVHIYIVEDDKNISDLIHMYLVKEGFDVRIAGDGGKALEEFQKKEPDLILLDIMLPVMDGWAVCAKIRETSKVPIIMLTAKSEVFDRNRSHHTSLYYAHIGEKYLYRIPGTTLTAAVPSCFPIRSAAYGQRIPQAECA